MPDRYLKICSVMAHSLTCMWIKTEQMFGWNGPQEKVLRWILILWGRQNKDCECMMISSDDKVYEKNLKNSVLSPATNISSFPIANAGQLLKSSLQCSSFPSTFYNCFKSIHYITVSWPLLNRFPKLSRKVFCVVEWCNLLGSFT